MDTAMPMMRAPNACLWFAELDPWGGNAEYGSAAKFPFVILTDQEWSCFYSGIKIVEANVFPLLAFFVYSC